MHTHYIYLYMYIVYLSTISATENYMGLMKSVGLQRMLDNVYMAKPEDAAFAIVRGGALRDSATYFPSFTARLAPAMYTAFPGLSRLRTTYLFESMKDY